jgi:hypothetical protein
MQATTTLNNGRRVLAKADGGALKYANRTQADRKARETGGAVVRFGMGRPFYISIQE